MVREQLATGGDITRSAAVVASWARYAEGVDEQGNPIDVVDKLKDQLTAAAQRQRNQPDAFIQIRSVFGDLADNEKFTGPYLAALQSLYERGARATLENINSSSSDRHRPTELPRIRISRLLLRQTHLADSAMRRLEGCLQIATRPPLRRVPLNTPRDRAPVDR